jgi:subtilisin-like proprotein convertase family protein
LPLDHEKIVFMREFYADKPDSNFIKQFSTFLNRVNHLSESVKSLLPLRASFIIFFSFLMSGIQAQKNLVTDITVSTPQSGPLTYGNVSSVTYTVTLTSPGGTSDGLTVLSLNWAPSLAGVTFPPTSVSVPAANTTTLVPITISTDGTTPAGNYNFTVISSDGLHTSGNASFVVDNAPLNITATGQSKVYGIAAPTTGTLNNNFTVTGLKNSDAVSGAALGYSGSPAGNLATAAIGSYIITPAAITFSTGSLSNYTPNYTDGSLTVTAASTTTAVTSNKTPVCAGDNVNFTATIASNPAGATGTVQFKDNGTDLGSPVTVSGNSATYSTSALGVGDHNNITAVYTATGNYSGSTSAAISQTMDAPPAANAGMDIVNPGLGSFQMTGANATGTYSSVTWGGEGTLGIFTGSGNPEMYTFTPSASYPFGSFTAMLTVTASGGCTTNATATRKVSWGATGSWIGAISTDWSDASNWIGGVPTLTTNVTIPAVGSVPFQPTLNVSGVCNNITINGSLNAGAGANNLAVYGDWVNNGSFDALSRTVAFLGTGVQTISGTSLTTFYNLILNNPAGLTNNNDVIITGVLTLTNGKITTGTNNVILDNNSDIPGASSTSYIYGNLQKLINGSAATTFEVGDASTYAPVKLTFTGANNSGRITANTSLGKHPQIATSFIDPAKNVNRYWTLSNSNVTFTNYEAVFNFVAGEATGTTSSYSVENYNGTNWTLLSNGTRNTTATQASTLTTFGDFVIGEEVEPAPCGPGGNTLIGATSNIVHCINAFPSTEITVSISMNAHQYFTMDVIQGMTYQVYTNGAPSDASPNNSANRLTMTVYDDDGTNSLVTFSYANTGNPKSSNTNNVFVSFSSPFSGRVRVLINQRYNCSAVSPTGISVYSLVSGGSNTLDNQNAAGNNTWIAHIYDGTNFGTNYNGSFSPYLGYNTEPETFNQGFGSDAACYNVFSNGLVRAAALTETFAIRYRMQSNRHGLYTVDMGSDDGSRLSVDGSLVYNNWSDQGWTNSASNLISLTGSSNLVLDFYENGGGNQISFNNLKLVLANTLSSNLSQTLCSGSVGQVVSGDAFGTLPNGINLNGTGYQWTYSSSPTGTRIPIAGATGPNYSISASAPFDVAGTYYIYRNAAVTSKNNFGVLNYSVINESNPVTLIVTANPFTISTPVSGGSNKVCVNGNSLAFTNAASGGQWSIKPGTGTSNIDASGVAKGLTAGDVDVVYTIKDGSNYCSASATAPLTVIALPEVYNVTGGGTYCADAKNLFVTLSNSQTGVSYQLLNNGTSSGGPIAGSNTTSLTFPLTTVTSGTYTILATNSTGCTSTMSGSALFVINDLPSGTLTVDKAVSCQGELLTFFATSGFTDYVFQNGGTILAQGSTVTYSSTTIPNGAIVTVLAKNANGCSKYFDTLTITVNPKPTGIFNASEASGIINDNIICAGSFVNFSFDNPKPEYSKYQAFRNGTTEIYNGSDPFFSTSVLVDKDEVTLVVTTASGCSQTFGPIQFTVNPFPGGPGDITGSTAVCQGQNAVVYSISTISAATGYTWTVPPGANIINGQGTTSITVNYSTTAVSGDVIVNGTNDCGTGPVKNFPVTVNLLPAGAGTITGPATVCQGATGVSYSVASITDAAGYTWILPAGATIVTGINTNSITVDFSTTAVTGDITVKGTNACGSGIVSADFPVTMNLLPSAAGTISGKVSVCVGTSNVSYSITPVDEATSYTWTYTGTGATINGNTNPVAINFAADAISGILTVVGTNACGKGLSSTNFNITVNPLPEGSIKVTETSGNTNNDGTICAGSSISFTASLTNGTGTNYEFFVNGVSKENGSSPTFTTSTITANVPVKVIVTNSNGCIATLDPYNVTVNALPNITIKGNNTICAGTSGNLYTTDSGQNNYVWTISGGTIDAGAGTDQVSITWAAAGTKNLNVNYTDANGCSSDKSAVFIIPPSFTPALTGNLTPCFNATETYITDADAGIHDYVWVIRGGTGSSTGNTISVVWDQPGPHSVSVNYTNGSGCSAVSPTEKNITINALPTAVIGGTITVCQDANAPNITFTGSAGKSEYTFTYNVGAGPGTVAVTSGSNTKTVSQLTDTPGTYTYNLISVSDANGCSQTASGSATIIVSTPSSATISYSGGSAFCKTSGPVGVTLLGTSGGTYSATPAGLTINSTTGQINPSTSTANNYTVNYSLAPAGGCGSLTTSVPVTITNLPTVSISYSASFYCKSVTSAQPAARTGTGNFTGGTYSASPGGLTIDASSGAIIPGTSTAGSYTVTYSTPASGGCGVVTAAFEVMIAAVPDVTVSYATPLCTSGNNAAVSFTAGVGAYTGGTFAGSPSGLTIDASAGIINPSTSIAGTYNINYLIPATAGCSTVLKNTSVTITAKPTVNAGSDFLTCAASGNVNIPAGTASNYAFVTWTTSGDGNFVNANSLNTASYIPGPIDKTNGSATLTLTARGNGACAAVSSSKLLTISPNPVPVVVKPETANYCVGMIIPLVSVQSGVTNGTGTYSSVVNNLDIPDNNFTGISSSIAIPAGAVPPNAIVNSISVKIKLTHPNNRDITVNLKSPNNNELNLINSLSGSGYDNTIISSSSFKPIQNFGVSPYNAFPYAPNAVMGALGAAFSTTFNQLYTTGGTISGNWVLKVADNGNGQTGTLNSWSITIAWSVPDVLVPVKWSPATDLYTDAAATIPYVASSSETIVYAKPSTQGVRVYNAVAGNGAGCETTTSVKLTGKPSPSVFIKADYCSDPQNRVTLSAETADPVSFNWSDGATTPTTYVDIARNYSVSVTNTDGCVGTNSINVAQELVINGDFEAGNTGFLTDYQFVTDNPAVNNELYPEGTYAVDSNAQRYHNLFYGRDHTKPLNNGKFMMINGFPGSSTAVIWEQTVAVEPNTDYYYSAWAMNLNPGSPAQLRFEVNGVQIGTTADLKNADRPSSDAQVNLNNWIRFYYGGYGAWKSGTNTTAVIRIIDLNPEAGGNDFGLDDISFATLSPFVTGPVIPLTDHQTICAGVPITPITYKVGSGATGPDVTGLPADLKDSVKFDGLNFTISGTSKFPGTYNYTIFTQGSCGNPRAATGTIIIDPSATMSLTSVAASENQLACIGAAVIPVTYAVAGGAASASAAWVPHRPDGVFGVYNNGVFNISGVPNESGTFIYTVTTTGGGCLQKTASGKLSVSPASAGGIVSSPTVCIGDNAMLTLSGNIGDITGWEFSTDGGGTWAPIANTTNSLTHIITGPSTFRAISKNGVCTINAASTGGKVQVNNLWEGKYSNDWSNPVNWSNGQLPSSSNCLGTVTIPKGTTYDPTLSGTASVQNLNIAVNGHLIVSPGKLQIAGMVNNLGIFDVTNGTIEFNGTSSQGIKGSSFEHNTVQNLVVSNTSSLNVANTSGDTLKISGNLLFGNANGKLNTGNNVTLLSNAVTTANVGVMNPATNTITGNVTVERYINIGSEPGQHIKAWEFLATPTTGQTVKQSWMEGNAPGANSHPGYGTQITGAGGIPAGFDVESPSPSMKYYDASSGLSWTGIMNPSIPISNQKGYMLFVRGDRSVDGKSTTTANATTLRTTGQLNAGTNTLAVTAVPNAFTSIGNPFAAAIDMKKVMIDKTWAPASDDNFFIVWNSNLGGAYGYGAYQTYTQLNPGGDFIEVPGAGFSNNYIQSGQAFFIQNSAGNSGNLVIKEQSKANVNTGFTTFFRPEGQADRPELLRTNLYIVNADGTKTLADGTLQQFNAGYSNGIDGMDGKKIFNSSENLCIKSGGKDLIVERRQIPKEQDTVFYSLTSVKVQTYRFEFIASNFSSTVQAYVEDLYLNTQMALIPEGTTTLDFAVTNVAASYAANRFRIVFKTAVALPVTFVSVKGYAKGADIAVEWKVENESNMKQYDVDKSIDGNRFSSIATVVTGNLGAGSYNWLDKQPFPGYNYYRIKSIDKNGKINYTEVVKVQMGNIAADISVYPNPVVNGIINLKFTNQPAGRYNIRLLNSLGQLIAGKQVERSDGNGSENLKWDYNLAHGIYQIEITKPNGDVKVIKVMY